MAHLANAYDVIVREFQVPEGSDSKQKCLTEASEGVPISRRSMLDFLIGVEKPLKLGDCLDYNRSDALYVLWKARVIDDDDYVRNMRCLALDSRLEQLTGSIDRGVRSPAKRSRVMDIPSPCASVTMRGPSVFSEPSPIGKPRCLDTVVDLTNEQNFVDLTLE